MTVSSSKRDSEWHGARTRRLPKQGALRLRRTVTPNRIPDGVRKREHIQHLIDETKESDDHKKILVQPLGFRSKGWISEITDENRNWIAGYAEVL